MEPHSQDWNEVAAAYRCFHELSRGDRQERLAAHEDFWWAWERVDNGVRDGTLPLMALDALVSDPEGGSAHRSYRGAGPLEDLLTDHADRYADAFAERLRVDFSWAEALRSVWLDAEAWAVLPEDLRRGIPDPGGGPGRQRSTRR